MNTKAPNKSINYYAPLFGILLHILPVDVNSQCAPCDLTPNGFTVRPGTNCKEYINCLNGEEVNAQQCGEGTIFDLAIVGCNWDYSVVCPPDPECETTTTTTTAATTTTVTVIPDEIVDGDIIPLKYSVYGLPGDVDESTLKDEAKNILELVLYELEELEKDADLKILDIEFWEDQRRMKARAISTVEEMNEEIVEEAKERVDVPMKGGDRILQSSQFDLMLMANVIVRPKEGTDFGPIIVQGIKQRYDSIISDVKGWTDSDYMTDDFGFDLCSFSMITADYTDCVTSDGNEATTSLTSSQSQSSTSSSRPMSLESGMESTPPPDDSGLPAWVIIVIVLVTVLLLCCIASVIIFVGCRKSEEYSEDDFKSRFRRYKRSSVSESSVESEENSKQLVPRKGSESTGYPDKCYVDEENHNASSLPRSSASVTKRNGTDGSVYSSSKVSRTGHSVNSKSGRRSVTAPSATGSTSVYSRRSNPKHPDPSVHNPYASDPSVYNPEAAEPSEYNPRAVDPEIRTQFSLDNLSHKLESVGGSRSSAKKSSIRMDYSVVSELSEPSVTAGRYA